MHLRGNHHWVPLHHKQSHIFLKKIIFNQIIVNSFYNINSHLKGVKLVDFQIMCHTAEYLFVSVRRQKSTEACNNIPYKWRVGVGVGVGVQYKWVKCKLYNFTELSDFSVIIFQPLMDNLESQTYEIFERDPIKYKEYQRVGYLVFSCWFFKCMYYQL